MRHCQRLKKDVVAKRLPVGGLEKPVKRKGRRKGKKGKNKEKKTEDGPLQSLQDMRNEENERDKWESALDKDDQDEEDKEKGNVDWGEWPTLEYIENQVHEMLGSTVLDLENEFENNEHVMDDKEKDTCMMDMQEKETSDMITESNGVDVPRELGHWRKIEIDAVNQKVICSDEHCNFDGRCFWVDTFESIEFGLVPPTNCSVQSDEDMGWGNKVKRAVGVMKHMNLRSSNSN
jgi:hypothetical protein